jgi:hypothetical protein
MSRDYGIQWPARRQLVKECAYSRLGLNVGRQARQSMIRRVRKGDVKYARKLTNSRTVIVLDHEGGEWTFLYSSATKEIICFLGPDAPEISDRGSEQAAPATLAAPVWLRLKGARG